MISCHRSCIFVYSEVKMVIHTVRKGDSIYSIAREYGVPPSRIITDNMLENPSKLAVGQSLVILFPTQTHTVRGGDTLQSIARMYRITLNELYRNNPILGGVPTIYPGQVLNISYPEPSLGEFSTNGYAYGNIDRATLRRTLPYLTYLSVFSTGIRPDGSLIPPAGEEELISLAYEYDATPLLVLTSLSENGTFSSEIVRQVLSSESMSNAVIQNTVNAVNEKRYGGVDVDFEYIPAELAQAYADFIRRMNEAVGDERVVFVSLAPKYSANQPGLLYEGHNYKALGEAADQVMLMTYEWGYTYGSPMPVAPLNEVNRVVNYAVSEIPRDKIFLGLPNYGYDWALPFVKGVSKAQSLSNTAAVNRAIMRGADIQYDETAQSPYYSYYDRPQTYSDAVEHIVWFEDARSADAKLRLAANESLDGGGVWNIMNFFPSLWLVMNQLFNIRK